MVITKEQREMVDKLHSGEILHKLFNGLRGDARRHNKLERSVFLAGVNEIYKQETKDNVTKRNDL